MLRDVRNCILRCYVSQFNANGSLIAYARGYDWHMGPPAPNAAYPVELMIRAVAEKDIKPKTQIGR